MFLDWLALISHKVAARVWHIDVNCFSCDREALPLSLFVPGDDNYPEVTFPRPTFVSAEVTTTISILLDAAQRNIRDYVISQKSVRVIMSCSLYSKRFKCKLTRRINSESWEPVGGIVYAEERPIPTHAALTHFLLSLTFVPLHLSLPLS